MYLGFAGLTETNPIFTLRVFCHQAKLINLNTSIQLLQGTFAIGHLHQLMFSHKILNEVRTLAVCHELNITCQCHQEAMAFSSQEHRLQGNISV